MITYWGAKSYPVASERSRRERCLRTVSTELRRLDADSVGPGSVLILYQAVEGGVSCGFSPVGYSGFVEDTAHVVVHRPAADDQFISNLPVRLPSSDEPQDLHLSLAQTVGVCKGS